MTKNTVNETERMVITKFFDTRELVWRGVDEAKYVMQWWGPKGFHCACLQDGFSRGRKIPLVHESAN